MTRTSLFLYICCFLSFDNLHSQNKQEYKDEVFKPFVKTARLYPAINTPDQDMQVPIVSLNSNPGLVLEFDALLEDYEQFQAKVIHCNANWTKSMLSDIEILQEYNAFDLNDFEYSQNTKTLYVHYLFKVPPTKVSGNFILKVFQNNDEDDVLLTKRFVVFENHVTIKPDISLSTSVSQRNFNHQLEFSLTYGGINVSNPHSDIYGLRPTLVRQDQSFMEYRHFNQENNFQAGNEFRFFDLRTYLFKGQHVAYINNDADPMIAHVFPGENRSSGIYSEFH